MELDVHLKREGEESWGFRLIGGKDFAMPLTVVKVVADSPASVADLRNGDAVCHVNGRDATCLSHDDAKRLVADACDLTLGVKRGLYDPVLDDYEPIYEPIDQEDFDQPSQPTEVDPFKIQQFLDPSNALGPQYTDPRTTPVGQSDPRYTPGLPELRDIETPRLNGTPGLNDTSRSLTASPFVLPTKPYRPFSTEPLTEVPPLEDPIILNPNYRDSFGKRGDGSGTDGELLPETRFKLPISEQYDPDGTKKRKKEGSVVKEVKFAAEDSMKSKKDVSVIEVKCTEELKQKAVEEKMFMEKMKREIDLDKIEMTAVSVVDESIERAVSVTDEIKKEIDVALRESSVTTSKVESKSVEESLKVSSEVSTSESIKETSVKSKKTVEKASKEATELVELIDKTTEELVSYNGHEAEVSVAKEVQKFESHDKKEEILDERRLCTKQEMEETIESGSVRRKSEVFDKKVQAKSVESVEKVDKRTSEVKPDTSVTKQEEIKVATVEDVQKKDVKLNVVKHSEKKSSEVKNESVSSQRTGVKSSTTTSRAKLQSDHTKAYLIGLHTIPNIKGSIQSYHYHLLLKTFFIHLTDVMVALSRFILTEPANYKNEESQETVIEESVSSYEDKQAKDDQIITVKQEEVQRKQSVVKESKALESTKEEKAVKEVKTAEKILALEEKVVDRKEETTKAQVTEKVFDRQEETKKAVAQEIVVEAIEEKVYRDDIQENLEVQQIMERKEKLSGAQMAQIQERKSAELTLKMDAVITEFQNKAGIEETEVTRERRSRSRSKVEEDVKLESDQITEIKSESKSFSSTMESTEKKRVEKHEQSETSSKSNEGKQMYVAIVESHVFTNKDAIFEEYAANFSETSSVVRANETNIASRAIETVAAEKVSLESKEVKKEMAETVVEEKKLSIANTQTEAVVHVAKEVQATAVEEETKAIAVVEETKAIVEEVKEELAVAKKEVAVETKTVIEEIKEQKASEVESKVIEEMAVETKAIIEEVKEEKAIEVKADVVQEVVIQEIIEPVVEVQELKTVQISEDFQKVSVREEEHVMSVSEKTEVSLAETHESIAIQEVKKEEFAAVSVEESKVEVQEVKALVVEKDMKAELVKHEIKKVEYVPPPIQEVSVELRVVQRARSKTPVYEEESAALTIVKPARTPTDEKQEIIFSEQSDVSISKQTEVVGSDSKYSEIQSSKASYESTEIQEATFTVKTSDESKKTSTAESVNLSSAAMKKQLTLDLKRSESQSDFSFPSTISTPTPATVPPTPLTDEYMFKLKAKMPKEDGTPVPRDCTPTPEDEDPNIVKKKLLPYIETTLESPIIYDPPLPSPPGDKPQSPIYTKPGLKGGCNRLYFRKEEILEIERKSSLLASAIDETIKSIEEYKEEVGIDTKREVKIEETSKFEKTDTKTIEEHTLNKTEVTIKSSSEHQPIIYNGYAKVETKVYNTIDNNKIEEEWQHIDKQVKESNEELTELSNNIDVEVDVTLKVNEDIKSEVLVNAEKGSLENRQASINTDEINSESDTESKKEDITAIFNIKSDNINVIDEQDNLKFENTIPKDRKENLETCILIESNGKDNIGTVQSIEVKTIDELSSKIEDTVKMNGYSAEGLNKTMNGVMEGDSKLSIVNGNMDELPQKSTTIVNEDTIDLTQKSMTNGSIQNINGESKSIMNGDSKVELKSEIVNEIPKAVIEKPSAMFAVPEKKEPMAGYRPIQFDPEEIKATRRGLQSIHLSVQPPVFQRAQSPSYVDSQGDLLGTHQGIVDGLEEAVVDQEIAKELGKPGMTEQKIAELISGESEMLREAHVMGLSRVLKSHMHRADDDSSVDFKKIKPIIESLKDSEVLKALNEEIEKAREQKRREEEKKWTTFLQKPKRPVPKAKFGYPGWVQEEEIVEEPYKVKIVKQPKPKVAPDYKPENFETGPLPWEERALNEPPAPPVEAEDPILIPEETPEFLEAVDPLPESEVPDLEDTGIPLPPPKEVEEEESAASPALIEEEVEDQDTEPEELDTEAVVEETERPGEDMEQNKLAEQLLMGVQNMVDPNASVEQQLAQMRAQVAALAQLPGVIQQTLELVTRQLSQLSTDATSQVTTVANFQSHLEQSESQEYSEVIQNHCEVIEEESTPEVQENQTNGEESQGPTIVEVVEETKPTLTTEEMEKLRREEEEMLEEQRRVEKQKKELMDQMKLDQESRQVKQRSAPRVGKPKPVFGPPAPVERPVVLPGGRRWRKPEDAYNEAFIKETLTAQAELIQGKTMGINFMKYEKPPVSLDHLQHSETYKLIHNMEQTPGKRVEMLTPVIAEADYREKCRSVTPSTMTNPQQVHP